MRQQMLLLLCACCVMIGGEVWGAKVDPNTGVAMTEWRDPQGLLPPVYDAPKAAGPFKIDMVIPAGGQIKPLTASLEGRVVLVVEDSVYNAISVKLTRFINDIEAQGFDVLTYRFVSGSAEDLRRYLQVLYNEGESLVGAQFIGNLPYVIYEKFDAYSSWPCDLFFMDMDGTWSDSKSSNGDPGTNGKYDTWDYSNLDIWVCRWRTDNLPSLGNETDILNNYFDKNHNYRQHTLTSDHTSLLYEDDDWWWIDWSDDHAKIYGSANCTRINDKETTSVADYKGNQLPQLWDQIHVLSHGGPNGHQFKTSTGTPYVYTSDYRDIDPPALFYNLFICSSSTFLYTDNLGSTVAFNDDSGLFSVGSTKAGSMIAAEYYYEAQADGMCFGDAFVYWFNNDQAEFGADEHFGWHAGMVMFGDATLRPSPKTFCFDLSLPSEVEEGDGVLVDAGRITILYPLAANLMVDLSSSDTDELTVPSSVTILAGQTSVVFNVTVVDDGVEDLMESVTVEAAASGWKTASALTKVEDPLYNERGNCLGVDRYQNDWAGIAHSDSIKPTNSLTVEVWVNLSDWSVTYNKTILGCTQDGGYAFVIKNENPDTLSGYVRLNGSYLTPSCSMSGISGGWHHLALTCDGRYVRLYMDGELRDTEDAGATYAIEYDPDNSLILGGEAGDGTEATGGYIDGLIDELRIWSSTRSEEQIRDNMHRIVTDNAAGLGAYYRFDMGSGNVIYDRTDNDNDGILHSTAWRTSTTPFSGDLGNETNIRAAWNAKKTAYSSGRMGIADDDIADTDFVAFGHDAVSETQNTVDKPSLADWRLERVWQVDESGDLTADIIFDLSGLTDDFVLLTDADGVFTDATLTLGTRTSNILTFADVTLQDGYYYTIASVTLPSVTTAPVTNVTETGAQCGGEITAAGGAVVTERGVCWNTWGSPTTADNFLVNGNGMGSFSNELTNLLSGQHHYIRAYATSAVGTGYGEEREFRTITVVPGNALNFDGVDDYVRIPHSSSLELGNSLTIEAWIKPSDLSTRQAIFSTRLDNDERAYQLEIGPASYAGDWTRTVGVTMPGRWLVLSYENVLETNKWYHIAYTRSSSSHAGTLYINGIDQTRYRANISFVEYTVDRFIGAGLGGGQHYKGQIDELRIWDVARSVDEIRDNMHTLVAGEETELAAYYRCDADIGIELQDQSVHANTGTLTNGTAWTQSELPCADDVADNLNLRGVWGSQTDSLDSGRLSVDAQSIADTDFAVFGHDDVAETTNTVDKPSYVEWRMNRAWQMEGRGSVTADINFDTTGFSGPFQLLVTTNGNFADAEIRYGSSTGSTFTVQDMPFEGSNIYTVTFGFIDLPGVTCGPLSLLTHNSVTCDGNETNEGGSAVSARGIVWSRMPNPTLDSNEGTLSGGSGLGSFSCAVSGLLSGTTYHIRAYASNNQGTDYSDALTFTTYLPPGNCLDLDGDNDYVDADSVCSNIAGGAYTIETWIYPHEMAQNAIFGCWDNTGGNRLVVFLRSTGNVSIYDYTAVYVGTSTDTFAVNRWHHIAISVETDGAGTLYINGGVQATFTCTNAPTSDGRFSIGQDWDADTPSNFTDGQMDEMRIWNMARTADQIRDNMHRILEGTEAGLVAYYSFDEDSGAYLLDRTGNGHTGTLISMADNDWVDSSIPCVHVIEDRAQLRGVWAGQVEPLGSGRMVLEDADATGVDYAIIGHDDDAETENTSDKPVTVDWRLNRIWRVEQSACVTADVLFDTTGFAGPFVLLVDDDGGFADATEVAGYSTGSSLLVPSLPLQDGTYYTLAGVSSSHDTPAVTTSPVSNITYSAVSCGGNVTDQGGTTVTERGVVWNTTGNPTLVNNEGSRAAGTGLGAFECQAAGLNENTTYYLSAYASNTFGAGYGDVVNFTTPMTPPGNCLNFDGINDKAASSGDIGPKPTDEVTVEVWVRLDDATRDGKIVSRSGTVSNSKGYILGTQNGMLYPEVWNTDGTRYTFQQGVVPAGQWTHLAIVYQRNNALIGYVNGVEVGRTNVVDLALRVHSQNGVYIGVGPSSFANFTDGRIDEVRVWHVARTEEEIRNNMHHELSGQESGLSAYYNFNDTSGTRLDDLTSDGSSYANLYKMYDNDWIASHFPCAAVIADLDNLRAVWSEQTNSLASSMLTLSDGLIAGSSFAVVGHNGGALDPNTSDKPQTCMWRLDRIWRTEDGGVPSGTLNFDCSSITELTSVSGNLRLLADQDEQFADASIIEGIYSNNIFTVTNQPFSTSNYYTLGMLPYGPYYVDASRPNDDNDGTSWATAKQTIQAAVDAAGWGETVYVTNGIYDAGGSVPHGQDYTNRVNIEKDITVVSVNGRDVTFIVGASDNGGNGPAAARCVRISDGLLSGFTITNGHTQTEGSWADYQRGGGVIFNTGGTVSNCTISGCSANITGGGVDFHYGGVMVDCIIEGNSISGSIGGGGVSLHSGALLKRCVVRNNSTADANGDGGGLYFYTGGTVRNCLIEGNSANDCGGGIYMRSNAAGALLESCTVVDNTAGYGGGVCMNAGTNRNSIIYENISLMQDGDNWFIGGGSPGFEYCCTTPSVTAYGNGNISTDPLFIGGGSYNLRSASSCVNAGSNQSWMTLTTDLNGQPRIHTTTVDMGAYEGAGTVPLAPANQPYSMNVTVVQNDVGNTTASVTLSSSEVYRDIAITTNQVNRGDYAIQIEGDPTDDYNLGILLSCIRENGRDNGGADPLDGVRYATSTIFKDSTLGYTVGVHDAPTGSEYNQNVAVAYFPFSENWICGHATNSSGNGPITGLNASSGLELGDEFLDNTNGTYTLAIPGINSLTDGVLLVTGGKNEDNFALSKANANGSWTIYCHDNGVNGLALEKDPIAFAYVPTGMSSVVVGKFDAEGDTIMGSGFSIIHTNVGIFELSIPGQKPSAGVLIVSPEGGESWNMDNILMYQSTGSVWVIQTRDLTEVGLQDLPADQPICSFAFFPSLRTINATADDHGSIAPSGSVIVQNGGTTNFVITPDSYWHILDVTTNGVSVGAVSNYTWSNITVDGIIYATFAADNAAGGTPCWWMADYGLTNGGLTFDQAETNNFDSDMHNNLQEYIANTDPTDSNDYLCVSSMSNLPPVTVYFKSSGNRFYSMLGCSNLVSGTWTNVSGSGPRRGIGDADTMQDTNIPAQGPYYRLEVKLP